jgi:Flp pilus assembly protein TadG
MLISNRAQTRDSRGQTLVEFALIIPVFILVLMGIFDLGRAVYAYNTANNAAREAARLAIVDQNVADIQAEAVAQSVALALTAADIDVDFRDKDQPNTANSCSALVIGCLATVSVNYTYQAATPVIGTIVGTINIVGTSQFPIESVCVAPASPCPKGN